MQPTLHGKKPAQRDNARYLLRVRKQAQLSLYSLFWSLQATCFGSWIQSN